MWGGRGWVDENNCAYIAVSKRGNCTKLLARGVEYLIFLAHLVSSVRVERALRGVEPKQKFGFVELGFEEDTKSHCCVRIWYEIRKGGMRS